MVKRWRVTLTRAIDHSSRKMSLRSRPVEVPLEPRRSAAAVIGGNAAHGTGETGAAAVGRDELQRAEGERLHVQGKAAAVLDASHCYEPVLAQLLARRHPLELGHGA